jgi:tRNA nucleotidyltransferase (CCA-adding enzyme)
MKKSDYDMLLSKNRSKKTDTKVVTDVLEEALKDKADIFLGGSYAKGTALKNFDIDVFVRFHKSVDVDLVGKILQKNKKKLGSALRVHGSRDYFQLKHKDIEYEIVPVLKIKHPSKAENITDVSFFHVEWIKNNLKNPDEARIAKLFAKANKLYGAESYINGFSGYILEILTAYYDSFENLIKQASKWKPKVVIDPEKHYSSSKKALRKLNRSKINSPLIIIDPVDKHRNAAAAVSEEIFSKFVKACKEFRDKPSLEFFEKKKFLISNVRKLATKYDGDLIRLKIVPLDGKKDIAYTKALVAFNFIKKHLGLHDFEVIDSNYEVEEHLFWYVVTPKNLSKFKKHIGPKMWANKENIDSFVNKHIDIFLDGNSLAVMRLREYVKPKNLVRDLIKKEEVLKRVRKVT